MEILRDRQDMEGVENLREGFMRQEALVLERQAVEEIQQPNITLFNSTSYNNGAGGGWGVVVRVKEKGLPVRTCGSLPWVSA